MLGQENKWYVASRSRMLYHAILFISFFAAFKLFPTIQSLVIEKVANIYLQQLLPYLIIYVGAIYLIPEIGFMIAKSFMEK